MRRFLLPKVDLPGAGSLPPMSQALFSGGGGMDRTNYLNFGEPDLNLPLYRYIELQPLYAMLERRQNQLSHPSRWGDPFENLTLSGRGRYPDGSIRPFGLRDHVYGQCWTKEKRSDAMWRIYCPADRDGNFDGVRIRTSLRRLANSLFHAVGRHAQECAFIGKVRYLPDGRLDRIARSLFSKGITPVSIAKSLLIKRTAFEHEREVRLIYRNLSEETSEDGRFRYPIDPERLITQIMVAPRQSVIEAEKIKTEIMERTAGRIRVKRSLLYKAPEGLLFDVPE